MKPEVTDSPAGYTGKVEKRKQGKKVLRSIEIQVLDKGYKVEEHYAYSGKDKYDYPSPPRVEKAMASKDEVLDVVKMCLGVDDESEEE